MLIKCFIQQLNPPPAFIAERDILFERLKAEHDAKLEGKKVLSICVIMVLEVFFIAKTHSGALLPSPAKEKTPIKVTLRDGKVIDGLAWKTTPYEIASSIRYECYVQVCNNMEHLLLVGS